MKLNKKKFFTSLLVCILTFLLFSMPVLAATSSFSKTTSKMNAINGLTVTNSFTGSAVSNNASITQVKVYLNVSSGSDPFNVYLQSPEGTIAQLTPSTTSGTYYLNDFNGESPKGTWYISVENLNVTYNPTRLYPTSTVTPTITVTYRY